MKRLSAISLGAVTLACSLMVGCNDEEQDLVPQMEPAKVAPAAPKAVEKAPAPAAAKPAAAPAAQAQGDEPQLVPLQSLSATKDEAPAKVAPAVGGAAPLSSGEYVIQVSIQASKKVANDIVKKLAENGVKAYIVEVENPGELEGTYYRIRVGYFANSADAQNYGKQALSPLNFAWWVDKTKNDTVGNPNPDAGESYSNSQTWEDDEEEEPAPAPSKPAPAPAPAPAPEPAPAPAPAPAPEPAPAPAPAPEPAPAAAPAAPAAPAPAAAPASSEPEDFDDWE
ncbi:SPOR domain-containing protein [Fibrobacter sp. UWEL]|uniref:SPOR domain-containing protein n=1 Tax=Fibrobacter sp. UWEL TaxID=1896209 RepID=UPI00092191D0|nr:SPOR domain-containing protein [Fibrobacter sp. UWEL]SHL23693.1 Sporulation related domain-containing protein [Fibrobacter sp. UWEL]